MNLDAPLPLSCPACAARMPETATFCPGCGRPMKTSNPAAGTVGSFPESVAGGLAYITFIPAIIFLLLDPYRKNCFVRFHSIQCLLAWVAMLAVGALLRLMALVVILIPVVGPLLTFVVAVLAGMAAFLIWLVLVVKAFQGETLKLPVLGDFAERYASPEASAAP